MAPTELISVVVPVHNEAENIRPFLEGLTTALGSRPHEILICYDHDEDTTLPAIEAMEERPSTVAVVKNDLGPGVANALRVGFRRARGDVVVVTMADLSDEPEAIPRMAEKVRLEGADVVSGSRYGKGGRQIGGPRLKRCLSRVAGLSLHVLGGLPTRDSTTNFRAYSRRFLETVRVESRAGFPVALELTVKAHIAGRKVDEVPTTWRDRSAGESRFRLFRWLPGYVRWYLLGLWGEKGRTVTGGVWPALFILLCVVFWFAWMSPPTTVAARELDTSWQQVLTHAASRGWQVGEDYLFTYGPWAWITMPTYQREVFDARIIGDALLKLCAAVFFLRFGLMLPGRAQRLLFLVLGLCLLKDDTLLMVLGLVICLGLCRQPLLPPWRAAIGLGTLCLISQIKFTFFVYAAAAVITAAISLRIGTGSWRRGGWLVGGFGVLWLLWWILAGQSPGNIPAYIWGSLQLASGYGEAMALESRPLMELGFGVAIGGLWAGGLIVGLCRRPFPKDAVGPVLVTLLLALLFWKQGFVRNDVHVLAYFQIAALLPLVGWPRWEGPPSPRRAAGAGLLAGGLVLALVMTLRIGPEMGMPARRLSDTLVRRAASNARSLLWGRRDLQREMEALRREEATRHYLRGVRRIVGKGTVDLLGSWEQGVVLLNQIPYRPRPVFQGYAAYSPQLLERNAAHLRSPEAPDHVLLRPLGLDRRYPGMEDGLALREVLHRYAPVYDEGGFLLLERVGEVSEPGPPAGEVLVDETVGWGAEVPVGDHAGKVLCLSLELGYSLPGRLRGLLLRPPAVELRVKTATGVQTFRIIPGMSRTGFIIQPLILNKDSFLACYGDPEEWPERMRVQSISVHPRDPDQEGLFRPEIRVRLHEVPAGAVRREEAGPFVRDGPSLVLGAGVYSSADGRVNVIRLPDGRRALAVTAPGAISLPVPPQAGRARVSFGLLEVDVSGPAVEFRASWTPWSGGGGTILWSQRLHPEREPADRGLQTAEFQLPRYVRAGPYYYPDPLRLEAVPPPGSPGGRQVFWADVEFLPP